MFVVSVYLSVCTYFVMEDHEIHRLGHANDQTSLASWFRLIFRKKTIGGQMGVRNENLLDKHVLFPGMAGMLSYWV